MKDLQFAPDALDRRGLLSALRAFKKGDFSVRLPVDRIGVREPSQGCCGAPATNHKDAAGTPRSMDGAVA